MPQLLSAVRCVWWQRVPQRYPLQFVPTTACDWELVGFVSSLSGTLALPREASQRRNLESQSIPSYVFVALFFSLHNSHGVAIGAGSGHPCGHATPRLRSLLSLQTLTPVAAVSVLRPSVSV